MSFDVLLEFQLFTYTDMKHSYQNQRDFWSAKPFLENDLGKKLPQTKLLAVKGLIWWCGEMIAQKIGSFLSARFKKKKLCSENKISGLEDAWICLENSTFSSPITHLLSVRCVLMKILSKASAKKKTERLKGFKFCTFIGRFQVTSWQWRG